MLESLRRPLLCFLTCLMTAAAVAGAAKPQAEGEGAAKPQAAALGGAMSFDDLPEPLDPKRPLDEAGRDRLHALALFSSGCYYQDNNEPAKALRQFQRAHQYDPNSRTIAQAAVELAATLGRLGQRDRYLLRLFDLGGGDPVDVEELAFRTAMSGRLDRAISIYERLLKKRKGDQQDPIDIVLRWRLSEIYYLAGKYKQAARCAAWVVDALAHPQHSGLDAELVKKMIEGPHSPFALFGEFFLLADQPERARDMFIKANAADPDKLLFEYRSARVEAKMGKNQEALERLQKCLHHADKLGEEGMEPYELLGNVLQSLGKEKELHGRLEKLYRASPENAAAGYALAQCYRRNAQTDKAAALYKKLLARHPAAMGYAGLMEIYRAEGRVADLLDLLGDAVKKTDSFNGIGEAVRAITADAALLDKLAAAARAADKSASASINKNTYPAIALLALDASRFNLASEFFKRALACNPPDAAELIMIHGAALLAADRHAEAAAVLRRGFAEKMLDEKDPAPYYYLANSLAMCDKFDEALAAARKAAELQKDSSHFAAQQGWVLYRAGRRAEAADVYEKLLKRFDGEQGEDVRETMRVARLSLAGIETLRGNKQRAEELLEKVLDEYPDDVSALNDLGYLWADDNRHLERAERMTRKAVAAEPENAAYRDSLGWALFRLGRLEEAAAELKKAAAMSEDEEIQKHLEKVNEQLKSKRSPSGDSGFGIRDSGNEARNPEPRTPNPEPRTPNP